MISDVKLLIVDDNEDASSILADAAKIAGVEQVETVASGEDAIGRAIMVEFDVITLDIRMPGISGLDALSVIRGLRSRAILAIVSAYTRDVPTEHFEAADVVFSKPVPMGKFQEMLQLASEITELRQKVRDLGLRG